MRRGGRVGGVRLGGRNEGSCEVGRAVDCVHQRENMTGVGRRGGS